MSTCKFPGCDKEIDSTRYCCGPHWYSLPRPIRDKISGGYKDGILSNLWHEGHAEATAFWKKKPMICDPAAEPSQVQTTFPGLEDPKPEAVTTPCKLCGNPIIFAKNGEGKTIPLDPKPAVYKLENGIAVRTEGHVTHFATCRNVDQLRPKKTETQTNKGEQP